MCREEMMLLFVNIADLFIDVDVPLGPASIKLPGMFIKQLTMVCCRAIHRAIRPRCFLIDSHPFNTLGNAFLLDPVTS